MEVICLMAATADGKIARDSNEVIDWTGKEDKKYFVQVTKKAGVMIMGSKTFDMIGKALPGRKSVVVTRDRTRQSDEKDLVFTDRKPEEIVNDLKQEGFSSAALIGGSTINSLFLEAGMVDEIHVTMVPKIFGKGLSLFDRSFDEDLELKTMHDLGRSHILLQYRILKKSRSSLS